MVEQFVAEDLSASSAKPDDIVKKVLNETNPQEIKEIRSAIDKRGDAANKNAETVLPVIEITAVNRVTRPEALYPEAEVRATHLSVALTGGRMDDIHQTLKDLAKDPNAAQVLGAVRRQLEEGHPERTVGFVIGNNGDIQLKISARDNVANAY